MSVRRTLAFAAALSLVGLSAPSAAADDQPRWQPGVSASASTACLAPAPPKEDKTNPALTTGNWFTTSGRACVGGTAKVSVRNNYRSDVVRIYVNDLEGKTLRTTTLTIAAGDVVTVTFDGLPVGEYWVEVVGTVKRAQQRIVVPVGVPAYTMPDRSNPTPSNQVTNPSVSTTGKLREIMVLRLRPKTVADVNRAVRYGMDGMLTAAEVAAMKPFTSSRQDMTIVVTPSMSRADLMGIINAKTRKAVGDVRYATNHLTRLRVGQVTVTAYVVTPSGSMEIFATS